MIYNTPPQYQISGIHKARITNYGPVTGVDADSSLYGGNRIAADWRFYPPGTQIEFYFKRASVIAVVHDRGGAVNGPQHFDWPTRSFERYSGLTSRGSAYIRFRVLRVPVHAKSKKRMRVIVKVGQYRSLEERHFRHHIMGERSEHFHYRRPRHHHHFWHHRVHELRHHHLHSHHLHSHHSHNRYGRDFAWDRTLHHEHFARLASKRRVCRIVKHSEVNHAHSR